VEQGRVPLERAAGLALWAAVFDTAVLP
jgi:hypothetical protein